jgi:energy-coupling factor transporter ATP-binding protein EcfA2
MTGLTRIADRMASLRGFTEAAQGYLTPEQLAPAEALVARAGERLALSGEHTVVALAGSTGTGKSSIFNAFAGVNLSQTGVKRPTTGDTHACVFGSEGADGLLDWLGVGRRFHASVQIAEGSFDGLVLLDLPDFDSVQAAHRVEADRLLAVVDLIVWVLHPQKYADKVVHRSYLSQFQRYSDITVVVLNQADLLSAAQLTECLDDLRRLLDNDGLGKVPILTTSTVGPPGLQQLSAALSGAVLERQAVLRRLSADLDGVTASLQTLIGVRGEPSTNTLLDALSRAAGVPMVAAVTEKAYVHRARKATGWPPLRWIRRFRPDPLARLHLEASGATSIGPASPAARAAVSLAVRDVAASVSLPEPWQDAVLSAARSKMDDLPDALDQAVARTDLGLARPRRWWRFVGVLQWLFVLVAAAGLLWLLVRYVMFALALPDPPMPNAGRLPLPTALLLGGLLAGLLLSLVVRPIVRLAARRARRRAERRLNAAVKTVALSHVAGPVQTVLAAHDEASKFLSGATKEKVRALR